MHLQRRGKPMREGENGKHGLAREMIELVMPLYDEQRHDIHAGLNLLQACAELGRRSAGLSLCDRLDKLERYDFKGLIDQLRNTLRYARPGDALLPQQMLPSTSGVASEVFRWNQHPPVEPLLTGKPTPIREQPSKANPAHPPPALSDQFRKELAGELERAGHSDGADILSPGIGMIKAGSHDLLPAWLKLFGRSDVYVVSVEEKNPQTAFVFGTEGDLKCVAVFTRLELAQSCMREFPMLKHAMKLNGMDLLHLARDAQKGIWINPMNEACSIRFPAEAIGRFIEEASR